MDLQACRCSIRAQYTSQTKTNHTEIMNLNIFLNQNFALKQHGKKNMDNTIQRVEPQKCMICLIMHSCYNI